MEEGDRARDAGRLDDAAALYAQALRLRPGWVEGRWAMGTILYEMATQKVAFTGESLAATVVNITSGRPAPITSFRPDAPPAFVELIDRATSTDPERRITTIEELRRGLQKALEPRSRINTPTSGTIALPKPAQPAAAPQGTSLSPPEKRKVNYWVIAGTALIAILGVVVGALAF